MARNNYFSLFAPALSQAAGRVVLTDEHGRAFRGHDLDRLSAAMAATLLDTGLSPGDRVSALVEKNPQTLCIYLACLRAGLIFHPLNPALTDAELAAPIRAAEPALLIGAAHRAPALEYLAPMARTLTLETDGSGSLPDAARAATPLRQVADVTADSVALLLSSSGTTGTPKGVPLSHANLASNTRALVARWAFGRNDCLLHALPVFHVHGLVVAIGCALTAGATIRFLPRFDVRSVIEHLAHATVMMGVPTYYRRLLDDAGFDAVSCRDVRLFVSGSAPLGTALCNAFERRTGHRIVERYGLTETIIVASTRLDGTGRPGTVGPALPNVSIRIVDDKGRAVANGTVGNVQVRGPGVFAGYWRRPDATKLAFTADGWFDTGDLGCIVDDDCLQIAGRRKDLVITGGLNVYPGEIEQVIDAIATVRESAVIGVPHRDFGEAVVACVTPASGCHINVPALDNLLRDRLAGYKVPKRFVVVDALPRNAMGKTDKAQLRERYADLFDAVS